MLPMLLPLNSSLEIKRPPSRGLVPLSEKGPQLDSFEELAMPLFEQLYNFAHWLTRNRDEAEDLVQETYVKGLRGFSSFHWAQISGRGCTASCATVLDVAHRIESNNDRAS